ncbi:MAG: DUF2809 domain-containing protein [Flavisolibacter sp.]|nr:DUF2809 domain-containing protein [Flavisolibacter sp.]
MLTFNLKYLLLVFLLFIIELFIALFVHDGFIRPYFGDYLVVMLIYCAVKTFVKASPLKVAAGVLIFSYVIEVLQYLHIVDRLGLSGNVVAKTVIGYGFEWWDILAYTLGVITLLILERQNKALYNIAAAGSAQKPREHSPGDIHENTQSPH